MTTTDPSAAGSTTAPPRALRRSRTDRVAAGVASGLGEYFGLDPVLFRVLFAVSAFFGGAGILAYLLAWAAIPEAGTARAPIDGWVGTLRKHNVPIWAVALGAGALLWLVAFSWSAPGPVVGVLAVAVVVLVLFGRRGWQNSTGGSSAAQPEPVDLTKSDAAASPTTTSNVMQSELREWLRESRAARRERVRRALPVKIVTLGVLAATLIVLAIVDAVSGVRFAAYFWCALGIVLLGLAVGVVLRRTPWSLAVLLIPALIGTAAFSGSAARLHDGVGQRSWTPAVAARTADYRLAFGQGTLDLRSLAASTSPRRIDITVGAGQVRILTPQSSPLTVDANVRFGQIEVRRGAAVVQDDRGHALSRSVVVQPDSGSTSASGNASVTVDVHLAEGQVQIVSGTS